MCVGRLFFISLDLNTTEEVSAHNEQPYINKIIGVKNYKKLYHIQYSKQKPSDMVIK